MCVCGCPFPVSSGGNPELTGSGRGCTMATGTREVLGPARWPRGLCLAHGHSGLGPRRGYQLPGLLPEGRRLRCIVHFGGRAPVGCPLRGNRRDSGWLPEAVVCFGGHPVVVAGNWKYRDVPSSNNNSVSVCVCVCVFVISVDRPGTRRRSSNEFTSSRCLRCPSILFTFSTAAAPRPVVLFARPR